MKIKTQHQYMWDAAKIVLRKFIALNFYTRKEERFQINTLKFISQKTKKKKKKQNKARVRRKKIITRAEIKKLKTWNNRPKKWYLKKSIKLIKSSMTDKTKRGYKLAILGK